MPQEQIAPKRSAAWSWIAPVAIAGLIIAAAIAFAVWRKAGAGPLWYPLIPLT